VIARVYFVDRSYSFIPDHQQARNQGGAGAQSLACKIFRPPGKMCWTSFQTIGHSLKNLAPSQKTLRPSRCPKLVTGLIISHFASRLWTYAHQELFFQLNCMYRMHRWQTKKYVQFDTSLDPPNERASSFITSNFICYVI